ncbi:MBL fold metallo-hydrolase [Limnobacter sp.]|uniref:MBL fold metallo-hydrolase n=1 Tax=Limnobacter sp. TaxID=2003368 RepID=UPI003749E3B6
MKIHHMNCGTMCPICKRLINGSGGFFERANMVCHCLLVESEQGLVLVDTGVGTGDILEPKRRLGTGFMAMLAPRLKMEETAIEQIKTMGFKASDVKHIVPTHLDLDHAGGLSDFPDAQVHVFEPEHRHAINPSLRDSMRFRKAQFEHGPQWVIHSEPVETWYGFQAIRPVTGVDLLMVPLIGHTRGHVGVAVKQGNESGSKWLLHCGDAYFHRSEVALKHEDPMPAGVAFFEKLVQTLPAERVATQARLRELVKSSGDEVELFCAHDPVEYARYS